MPKHRPALIGQFLPANYELSLQPGPDNFTSTVIISGRKVGPPSQRLTFHQKGLRVLSANAVYHGKKADEIVSFTRINHHLSFEEVRLHAAKPLYPGNYTVTIAFQGKGPTPNNPKINRTNFPCIDESGTKATLMLASGDNNK